MQGLCSSGVQHEEAKWRDSAPGRDACNQWVRLQVLAEVVSCLVSQAKLKALCKVTCSVSKGEEHLVQLHPEEGPP